VSSHVLDASALLALLKQEQGQEVVAPIVDAGAAIGAINLSEVVARLCHDGRDEHEIRRILGELNLEIISFDEELAYQTGLLLPLTRHRGLSLGDRACLALAARLGLPALTADRSWAGLQLGVQIEVVR